MQPIQKYEIKIAKRLKQVLSDGTLFPFCLEAYSNVFTELKFKTPAVLAQAVLEQLKDTTADKLLETEASLRKSMQRFVPRQSKFSKYMKKVQAQRHQTMLLQIKPMLPTAGLVCDFGAGDGAFLRKLEKIYDFRTLQLEGWDVVEDDKEGTVKVYNEETVPVSNNYYDTSYSLVALHHSSHPIDSLAELRRITKRSIILIETIPPNFTKNRGQDWDIMFVIDYLYRLLMDSREPVPGNYLSVEEWKTTVAQLGLKMTYFKDLGVDQPTIAAKHIVMRLEKQ